jgi:hypothetical protein
MELAFQGITLAVDSGHPIVIRMLQSVGLDIGRLCKGYKRSSQLLAKASGDRFGECFDNVFESPMQKYLIPISPSEKNMES